MIAMPRDRQLVLSSALIAITLLLTLIHLRSGNTFEVWSLAEQSINRSLLSGVRSVGPQIRAAHSVLVVGIDGPFHPWQHPKFLERDLGYTGRWSATIDPGGYFQDPTVQMVKYEDLHWSDYDLIIVFRTDGTLVGSYRPEQLTAMQRGKDHPTNLALIRGLQASPGTGQGPAVARAVPAKPADDLAFPTGVLTVGSAAAALHGVFATTNAEAGTCCWVGPDVRFTIRSSSSARSAVVTLYQPAIPALRSTPQTISFIDANGKSSAARPVPDGFSTFTVPLPRKPAGDVAPIAMHFSRSFIPKDVGLGNDDRRLSVILRNVAVR